MSKSRIFIRIGIAFIVAAILLTVYNYIDQYRAGRAAEKAIALLETQINEAVSLYDEVQGDQVIPDYMLNPDMDLPVINIDGADYAGMLSIPALSLKIPVIRDWSYPGLKKAPCRYTGTPYKRNMILAGHNYSSHFGRLKELQYGDKVQFTDVDGNTFTYSVAAMDVLMPTAVEEMEVGDWDLTLFTCTIGGRSRVTVRCIQE